MPPIHRQTALTALYLVALSGLSQADTVSDFGLMIERVISRTADRSADPASSRMNLLARLTYSPACFPADMSEEDFQAVVDEWGLLPPTQLGPIDERFFTDSMVWTGDISLGSSGQAAGARLTYSFPADGVTWGLSAISATGANELNSRFASHFGASNIDRGRELIRQCFASWRRYGGLSYDEVADNGEAMNQTTTRSPDRGDIRVGGLAFGTGSFLAYNAFPSASGAAGVGGGDMCINTSFFTGSEFNNPANNYRYLRNTCAHEHGHGLGNIHVVPCNSSKLMEPSIFTTQDMLQIDERRGAGRSYGDRFSGNHTPATAKDFGNLTSPVLKSIIERNLSTNGATGPNGTSQDFFRFTIGTSQPVTITAAPTGGSYSNGQQLFSCFGSTSTINAGSAGNLNIELRDAAGTTVLQTAAAAGAGVNEVLNAGTLAAGTYTVRIFDVGPNSNQTVQLYDLTIRIASAPAAPLAIAGVNKRIAANTNCFFMGDINSAANETSIGNPTGYDWDLDGDGTFEVMASPQPNRQYPSNGVYPVTLRVTDDNGMTATDTIMVTVFGATTTVTNCVPGTGNTSTTVPVTITGTNLKNVTSASHVTVSGGGVTVIGIPVPNALGTSVSGLSFQIDSGAAGGARDITVSNADGSGTGVGLFFINAAPPPAPGPFNLLAPANGSTLPGTAAALSWSASTDTLTYDVEVDDNAGFASPEFSTSTVGTAANVPVGTLNYKIRYFWRVTAVNGVGSTPSTPSSFNFRTGPCLGDANYDRNVDFGDITTILGSWNATYPAGESGLGDSSDDDSVDFNDITVTLSQFGNSCP